MYLIQQRILRLNLDESDIIFSYTITQQNFQHNRISALCNFRSIIQLIDILLKQFMTETRPEVYSIYHSHSVTQKDRHTDRHPLKVICKVKTSLTKVKQVRFDSCWNLKGKIFTAHTRRNYFIGKRRV